MKKEQKIIELHKCSAGRTKEEIIQECKAKGLRPLSNKEWDVILQDDTLRKKYYDYWPAFTSTSMSYKANSTKGTINEWGKKPKPIYVPLDDNYYKMDKEFGFPNGAKSDSSDPEARYLYRWQNEDWSGLLARGGFDYYGRVVGAFRLPSGRLGVLAVKDEKAKLCKHKWDTCSACGETKGKKKK